MALTLVEYLAGKGMPYLDQFRTGDRVKFRDGYKSDWQPELGIGTITQISENSFEVLWDDYAHGHLYTKFHIASKQWWEKVLEKPKPNNFPELSSSPKTQGYLEEYLVINKQKKIYFYTRYVYQESSGKLKHYHVPKKQKESVETLWRSGASAKEICLALGKSCK